MMVPGRPASTMRRAVPCATRHAPSRLVPTTPAQSSSVTSRVGAGRAMPELFTRMSGTPSASCTASSPSATLPASVTSIRTGCATAAGVADLVRKGFEPLDAPRRERHRRPVRGEGAGEVPAETARRPGHERGAAAEVECQSSRHDKSVSRRGRLRRDPRATGWCRTGPRFRRPGSSAARRAAPERRVFTGARKLRTRIDEIVEPTVRSRAPANRMRSAGWRRETMITHRPSAGDDP